eukprot:UN29758
MKYLIGGSESYLDSRIVIFRLDDLSYVGDIDLPLDDKRHQYDGCGNSPPHATKQGHAPYRGIQGVAFYSGDDPTFQNKIVVGFQWGRGNEGHSHMKNAIPTDDYWHWTRFLMYDLSSVSDGQIDSTVWRQYIYPVST